jgi:hypothetical protein
VPGKHWKLALAYFGLNVKKPTTAPAMTMTAGLRSLLTYFPVFLFAMIESACQAQDWIIGRGRS